MLKTHFAPSPPSTAEYRARGARFLAVLRFSITVSDELSGDPFILLSEFCFFRTYARRYGTLSRNVRECDSPESQDGLRRSATKLGSKLEGQPWFGRVSNRSANIDGWPHGSIPRKKVPFDKERYRGRYIVERGIGWLKEYQIVFARYEESAKNFCGMILLGFIQR